jgi:hypothetical protein
LIKTLLSRLLWWVLRGSEKEPEGGERKGGGKGLGGLFANKASPVSNLKGIAAFRKVGASARVVVAAEEARSGRHLTALWAKCRHA